MKKRWLKKLVKVAVIATAACAIGGFAVMSLWNWLAPAVFGGHLVTFWQALGLLVLSRLLFGRFGGWHGGRGRWSRGMKERWERMTPEEREKVRNAMREHCGRAEARTGSAI